MSRGPQSRHPVDEPAQAEPSGPAESDKIRGESGPGGAGAAIASLEPALWKRLTDAGSLAEAARAWLALQCQMIEGASRGIVLLAGDQANNFAAAGYWPEGSGKPAALIHAAEAALRERRGVASDDPSGAAEQHVGLPILLDDELAGAVAVTIRGSRGEDGRLALRQLQWGIAWIRERLRQARAQTQDRLLDRSRAALELLGGALDH